MAPSKRSWTSFYILIINGPGNMDDAIKELNHFDVTIIGVDRDLSEIYTEAQVNSLKQRRFDYNKPHWLKEKVYVGFWDKNNSFY